MAVELVRARPLQRGAGFLFFHFFFGGSFRRVLGFLWPWLLVSCQFLGQGSTSFACSNGVLTSALFGSARASEVSILSVI